MMLLNLETGSLYRLPPFLESLQDVKKLAKSEVFSPDVIFVHQENIQAIGNKELLQLCFDKEELQQAIERNDAFLTHDEREAVKRILKLL